MALFCRGSSQRKLLRESRVLTAGTLWGTDRAFEASLELLDRARFGLDRRGSESSCHAVGRHFATEERADYASISVRPACSLPLQRGPQGPPKAGEGSLNPQHQFVASLFGRARSVLGAAYDLTHVGRCEDTISGKEAQAAVRLLKAVATVGRKQEPLSAGLGA